MSERTAGCIDNTVLVVVTFGPIIFLIVAAVLS